MKELLYLGNLRFKNQYRNNKYSVFLCEACGKKNIKIVRDGRRQKYCSLKCFGQKRDPVKPWKKHLKKGGYNYIYKPGHPNAVDQGKYVAEHRLVISEKIGRPLKTEEVVRHINGVKDDNRIENLELMTNVEHSRMHMLERLRQQADELEGRAKWIISVND